MRRPGAAFLRADPAARSLSALRRTGPGPDQGKRHRVAALQRDHNDSVKKLAWVPALILSAGIHAALLLPQIPKIIDLLQKMAHRAGQAPSPQGAGTILGFAIGWCVTIGAWSAMVTNVLASPDNRWGGLGAMRLIPIVVGFTIALDLLDSPCLFSCPPIALVLPILSYVAIFNNSMPPPEEGKGQA